MIYAYITPGKFQNENERQFFYLEFYWDNCEKEKSIWDNIDTDATRVTIIWHLANRWFIPWGENIFYKKWFFEKFL